MSHAVRKSIELSCKDAGGTGKGPATRLGLDLAVFGENLTKIKSKGRKMKCLDCKHFNGINPCDIVHCAPESNKHKGLDICESNFVSEYDV